MELHVWEGDWGLYSADPHCLQVLAYIQLTKAPVAVFTCNNPRLSPQGELPFLRDGDTLVATPWRIIHYLKRKGYNADQDLSPRQHARVDALWAHCETCLAPALTHDRFVGEGYYATRAWMNQRLAFPLSLTVPRLLRIQAQGRYLNHLDSEGLVPTPATRLDKAAVPVTFAKPTSEFGSISATTPQMNEAAAIAAAEDASLRERLQHRAHNFLNGLSLLATAASGEYLLGSSPSTLDAVLYGYIVFARACKAPQCTATIAALEAPGAEAVVRACERFGREYMRAGVVFSSNASDEARATSPIAQAADEDMPSLGGYIEREEEEEESRSTWRQQEKSAEEEAKERTALKWRAYQSYAVAGVAMLAYAVATGLAGREDPYDDDDYGEEEEEDGAHDDDGRYHQYHY